MPLNEAEDLLRGATGLQQGEHLSNEAHTILERCHHVEMDMVFVGRWRTVRARDRVDKGKHAWAEALGKIDIQVDLSVEKVGTPLARRVAM